MSTVHATATIRSLVVGLTVVAALAACPAPTAGSDIDDGDCPLGAVTATSTGEDIGGCFTAVVTTASSITLTLGEDVSLDIDLFGDPPALPETWGDVNSTTFGTIRRGDLEWRIADGSFDGGAPVGEAETTVTERDGDTLHGTFRGVAVSTSLDALVENLFVDATF